MTVSAFSGPVAEFYARFRRGCPDAVVDRLAAALGLDVRSRVLDIGCGTGQLTLPLAARTRAVVGARAAPCRVRTTSHTRLALRTRPARCEGTARCVKWLRHGGQLVAE
jgi:cyclopropane fatty-acyl-phospholipid synthase-like methyltransferase